MFQRLIRSFSTKSSPIYVGAIDQGTQSSRFVIYSWDQKDGLQTVASATESISMNHPQVGWAEQDPWELLSSCEVSISKALSQLPSDAKLSCVGITNQRETTIAWDSRTSQPLYKGSLVWLDARTRSLVQTLKATIAHGDADAFRPVCGLPLSTYFSAVKMRWLLDNCPEVRRAAAAGSLMLGTVDAWLLYHLTGGQAHATDVTNASRTMLMGLDALDYDAEMLSRFGIPRGALPSILPSGHRFGAFASGPLKGTPITGVLGDQQAALVGQHCFRAGEAKNTYGTGCFLLTNTGPRAAQSSCGLLSTVAFQMGGETAYALEGSVAIAGAGIRWLKENMGLVQSPAEAAELAASVKDTADVYFVPAFGGLFAPYWRSDARGCIVGLTQYTKKANIVRAMFESVAFQTAEILGAIKKDTQSSIQQLRVDGGMVQSDMLMQFQADILDIPVMRPKSVEATAKGAAIAALIGSGLSLEEYIQSTVSCTPNLYQTFLPQMDIETRQHKQHGWQKAIFRALDWIDEDLGQSSDDE